MGIGDTKNAQPLAKPTPLIDEHSLTAFQSGEDSLDHWLTRRARRSERPGAARTYVVCPADQSEVVGYYSLATGAVAHEGVPGRVRRNMPDPIPVMILARLAVDESVQGRGIGRGLVQDAILRTLRAAEIAGIRALLVHALSDRAAQFYLDCGFAPSPIDPLVLMLTLDQARASLA